VSVLRLFPRLLRDQLARLGVLVGLAVVGMGPVLWGLRGLAANREVQAGVREGMAAGGAAPFGGLLSLMLTGGSLFLWRGIVADRRREGLYRVELARPIWRPGLFLACHIAKSVAFVAVALLPGIGFWWVGRSFGLVWSPAGTALAAAACALLIGSLIFLASAWMDRGDALLILALLLLYRALGLAVGTGPSSGTTRAVLTNMLPPFGALFEVQRAFIAGSAPESGAMTGVAGYGLAALIAGLVSLQYAEFRSR